MSALAPLPASTAPQPPRRPTTGQRQRTAQRGAPPPPHRTTGAGQRSADRDSAAQRRPGPTNRPTDRTERRPVTTTTDHRRGWQDAPHRRGEPIPSVPPPTGQLRLYSWTDGAPRQPHPIAQRIGCALPRAASPAGRAERPAAATARQSLPGLPRRHPGGFHRIAAARHSALHRTRLHATHRNWGFRLGQGLSLDSVLHRTFPAYPVEPAAYRPVDGESPAGGGCCAVGG